MRVAVSMNEEQMKFVFTVKEDDYSTITVIIPRTEEGPSDEFLDLVYSMDLAFDGALEEIEKKRTEEEGSDKK